MEPAPITPLGAQTPRAHPLLPKVIGAFVILILGCVYLVWVNTSGTLPYGTSVSARPTASTSTGGFTYKNKSYGFSMALPQSWLGYTTVAGQWQGTDVASGAITEHGPLIKIRNPSWTSTAPYEDIPVMVFTPAQWAKVQAQTLSLGAAPISPSELGRNAKYILALPARYNYDFKPGYEEVDTAVHQLQAFDPAGVKASCMPRPACLDATPRCLPPEPASGWCK